MFHYFRGSKKFGKEGEEGVSKFPAKIFLSDSAESFHRGILWCLISFGDRRSLWIRHEEGGVSKFSVEFFCLTVPENFVREPFSVSLFSGIEKFFALEG